MNGVRRLFSNNASAGSGSTVTATETTIQTTVGGSVGNSDGSTAWTPIIIGRQPVERPSREDNQPGTLLSASLKAQTEQPATTSFFSMRPTGSPEIVPSSELNSRQILLSSTRTGNSVIAVNSKTSTQSPHHGLIMELLASESAIECKDFRKLEPDEVIALKKVCSQQRSAASSS